MGTRCVVTFKDSDESFAVYKHWDGNPYNIKECIDKAKAFAWPLPRFEASDFAAAFIAANKTEDGGDIRMSKGKKFHDDLSYAYTVTVKLGELVVKTTDCES